MGFKRSLVRIQSPRPPIHARKWPLRAIGGALRFARYHSCYHLAARSRPSKHAIHAIGHALTHGRGQMGVDVGGRAQIGVAEHLGDDAELLALIPLIGGFFGGRLARRLARAALT